MSKYIITGAKGGSPPQGAAGPNRVEIHDFVKIQAVDIDAWEGYCTQWNVLFPTCFSSSTIEMTRTVCHLAGFAEGGDCDCCYQYVHRQPGQTRSGSEKRARMCNKQYENAISPFRGSTAGTIRQDVLFIGIHAHFRGRSGG
ncbi:hypothetical protein FB451DRAFT_1366020 [Mycena latifolia]|nr:hypothetical protein FB451DRAFT_1366020 [Mycena latifolia]